MALKTQGFALSSLGSAPDIPANVGKIDAGAIYNSLKQGLDTAEQMRQRAAQQIAADAELRAAASQAPMRTAILASQADQAPIQTALLADRAALSSGTLPSSILAENATNAGTVTQAPALASLAVDKAALSGQTLPGNIAAENATNAATVATLPYKTAILAAQASPEYLAAQRQHLLASSIPQAYREFEMLTAGMTPEQKEQARRIKFGIDARQSGAAIQYKEVVGPDGITRLVAVDPRAVGAQVVGSGETYGTGVSAPLAQRAPAPVAVPVVNAPAVTPTAPAATPANVFASQTPGDKKSQETVAMEAAKLQADRQQKLPKAQSALQAMESNTGRVDSAIDKALDMVDSTSAGIGSLASGIPTTKARILKNLLLTIRANTGFDQLQVMRQNSPTGGALGAVSDVEGAKLDATIASLDQGNDPEALKEALRTIKEVRHEMLRNVRNSYEQDFKLAEQGGMPKTAAQTAVVPTAVAAPAPGVRPVIATQAQFDALPSGAEFATPSGSIRRKP